ncbi:hypothetical protein K440DRAFT_633364 [Wilcoxina mikolae CBS 423.85]|nr:hypothetical protein K440DRAFT_609528 [Wilcoxina mikolae CBS 423.85]KAF8245711.1 hypothetical protein K440DRAFT_633364 [Wilcoxina mikolae CBS 423.85]
MHYVFNTGIAFYKSGVIFGWNVYPLLRLDESLQPVFSTVPSVRNSSGRDGTANRRPSEGRTETAPSF